MDFYDVIACRRSIRGYKPDAVPQEAVERIKGAVSLAPSACNRQPLKFVFVTNPEVRKAAASCYTAPWLAEAPMIVLACGDADSAWHRFDGTSAVNIDLGIAMEHLVLSAAAEGLGTCWICAFDIDAMTEACNIPSPWKVLAVTPVGYANAVPRELTRKTDDDLFMEIK